MNKNEQSQLCMLLAKLRYDLMEQICDSNNGLFINDANKLIEAINKILIHSSLYKS